MLKRDSLILGIETSCDETGLSLINRDGRFLASLLSSQERIHEKHRGVVPELAARQHLSALPVLFERLRNRAGERYISRIKLIGVTCGPGLPPCLLTGVNFAKGLGMALSARVVGVNHLEAHIFSTFIGRGKIAGIKPPGRDGKRVKVSQRLYRGNSGLEDIPFPHIALIVSGGHTELILVKDLDHYRLLGETLDDAAGELFDKVAINIGEKYPGGARIERLSRTVENYRPGLKLPTVMTESGDLNFSFSGLKTETLKRVRAMKIGEDERLKAELSKSLLDAVIRSIWWKIERCYRKLGIKHFNVTGGVARNKVMRARFVEAGEKIGLSFLFPDDQNCMDNADMVAWLVYLKVRAGKSLQYDFDIDPNLRVA